MRRITGVQQDRRVTDGPSRMPGRPSRKSILGPVLLCPLLLCAIASLWPARAQGSGEYGPHIAYSKAVDSDKGNYLVGGHMELHLAPFLGLRGAVDYRSSERFAVGGPQAGSVRIRSVPVTLSGRLYLPLNPSASPFLQGGAGWYHVSYDYSNTLQQAAGLSDESVTTFGWHVGGGLRLALSPSVSVSGEAQYIFVDPQKRLDSEVRDKIRSLDYDTTTFGLGLSIAF